MTSPPGSTASRPSTWWRVTPYFTARMPPALVATLPPRLAEFSPGNTGYTSPTAANVFGGTPTASQQANFATQVLDNIDSPYGENPRQAAASLFFCMAPSKDATRAVGEWNTAGVTCKGTVIQHWLNGQKVIDFDYTDPRWAREVEILKIRGGNLAARGGSLSLQDHGQAVWFRSLRWRTIPPDEQLVRSDFTPLPIPPAALEKENARIKGMLEKQKK